MNTTVYCIVLVMRKTGTLCPFVAYATKAAARKEIAWWKRRKRDPLTRVVKHWLVQPLEVYS